MRTTLAILAIILTCACGGRQPAATATSNGDLAAAMDLYTRGKTEDAKQVLLTTLKQDPGAAQAHFLLAQIYAEEGRDEMAIVGFERAAELEPAYAEAHYNLGTLYLRLEEPIRAAEVLERAAELRPDHAQTFVNLGIAYFRSDLPQLAAVAFEHAEQIDPDNIAALTNLELMARAAGATELAEEYTRKLQAAKTTAKE
jgi:Tfp pilus assembly protein PilF